MPNTINCKDATGKKQGWWIYYKVDYHPTARPNIYDSGNYVGSYRYGQFKDDKMVGEWIKFNNIHLCYEERVDSFYYKKDTVGVYAYLFTKADNITIEYINDSTIINARSIYHDDTICVYCNTKTGCKVMHRNNLIRQFPFGDIETSFVPTFEQIHTDHESTMYSPRKNEDLQKLRLDYR